MLPVERKKANVRRKTLVVSGMRVTIVHKNRHRKPPHFLSQLHHEVDVCRGRSIRGESNHGSILRQPCRYYLKGTCTRTSCEYWHPPKCQFYKKKRVLRQETSVCFRITRLMNNQIQSRRRATSQKEEKATTRMLWLL